MRHRVLSLLIPLVVIVVVYGMFNLVVVGAQKIWHQGGNEKLASMTEDLEYDKTLLESAEEELTQAAEELEEVKMAVKKYESDYPDGIPDPYYADYEAQTNLYNELLSSYEDLYANYESDIESYNSKTDEANKLAEDVGSTWFVLPIPGK